MSPWIFGRNVDLAVFVGPTAIALALAGLVPLGVVPTGRVPPWAWVLLVVSVDVAHVHATLFRTYLDLGELRRRPWTYVLVPAACLAGGIALYAHGSASFWRVLAYVAVFHFVRQQIGWVAIYRAKSGPFTRIDRFVDDVAIYVGTGVPLLAWHASLPKPFSWFVEGDFVPLPMPAGVITSAWCALGAALAVFAIRQVVRARSGLPVSVGKSIVIASTALSWTVGIAVVDHDLGFTALNVLPHGIPYFVLLYAYGRARATTAPAALGSRIVRAGVPFFLATLLFIAVVEETLWDRLVWRDHGELFGALPAIDVRGALWFVVPLLTLPQSVHYVLDALLWRRGDGGTEQAAALGFRSASVAEP